MIQAYKHYLHILLNTEQVSEDELKEASIIIVPMVIGPISLVWALIYIAFEQYIPALIPLFYSCVSFINLWCYRRNKNLLIIQKVQMLLVLILPFLLMWTLGGFAQGSYVMIWAFFAPIASLIHEKEQKSQYWLYSFVALVVLSVVIDPLLITHYNHTIPPLAQEVFFFLNVTAALCGIYLLLKYFIRKTDINTKEKLKEKHNELMEYTQDELTKMFYTDSLTGLPNRRALIEAKKEIHNFSLLLINIDTFSQINDLYGEKFGDKVLIKFSEFLQENLKKNPECKLFRLSGDEFVLLSKEKNRDTLKNNLTKLIEEIHKHPLTIEDHDIYLNITVGISFEETELLLPTANMALKLAKKESKNIVFYSDEASLNEEYENNLKWIQEIKDAILENRIVMFFQPIMDNKTRTVTKYESLIRLVDKKGNIITPWHFLEIAKKAKLYKKLTKIVIRKSFEAFKDNTYDFSINLTIEDILDHNMNEYIFQMLQNYGIGKRVIFEIVESESIKNFDTVERFIKKVKSYGCRIAIDDFGTGYSNFEYLMKLQADFIKIDGSIIKSILNNKSSEVLTSVIISFAKEMNIKTIAEYVETKEIHEKLIKMGVNKSQGYYIDKPSADLH
ncbi:EAL domain-containing protein [Sulfurimonas sp. NW15]|uniref:EAL domain-containing protein n=1 Tax=Sulfurimonas sp. NW15 TaxID=2922729 RepID=UPI003DA8572A